jgi:hypothetical protein
MTATLLGRFHRSSPPTTSDHSRQWRPSSTERGRLDGFDRPHRRQRPTTWASVSETSRDMSKQAPRTSLSRSDASKAARDDGQAAVLVIAVAAVLFVAVVLALGVMGRTAVDRTRAQTAADAAALGSLDGGSSAAVSLAQQHGAFVVRWFRGPGPGQVTVTVRLGDTTATARASNAP